MTEQLDQLYEQVAAFHNRLTTRRGEGLHPTVSSLGLNEGVEIAELLLKIVEELKRIEGEGGALL